MKLLSIILSATMLFKTASSAAFMATLTGTGGSSVSIVDNDIYDNNKALGVISIGGNKNKFLLDGISFDTYINYGVEGSVYFVNLNSNNSGNGLGKFSIYTSFSGLDTFNSDSGQFDYNATSLFFSGTSKKNTADITVGSFVDEDKISTSGTGYAGSSDSFELKNVYTTNDSKQINFNDKYFAFNNFIEVDLNEKSHYNMNTTLSSQIYFCAPNPQPVPEPKSILLPFLIMGVMIISRRKR